MPRKRYGAPLSVTLQQELEKYVQKQGERQAAREIGINLGTLLRALAKLNVQSGTSALIKQYFTSNGIES